MRATYEKKANDPNLVEIVLTGRKDEVMQVIDALMAYPVEAVLKLGEYLNRAHKR